MVLQCGLLNEVLHAWVKLGRTGRYVLDLHALGVGRQRLASVLRRSCIQHSDLAVVAAGVATVLLGRLTVVVATAAVLGDVVVVATVVATVTAVAAAIATVDTINDDLDQAQTRDEQTV